MFAKPESIPAMVMVIDEFQHKSVTATDAQIPLTACAIQLMTEIEWL